MSTAFSPLVFQICILFNAQIALCFNVIHLLIIIKDFVAMLTCTKKVLNSNPNQFWVSCSMTTGDALHPVTLHEQTDIIYLHYFSYF